MDKVVGTKMQHYIRKMPKIKAPGPALPVLQGLFVLSAGGHLSLMV